MRVADLKKDMDQRFAEVDQRFDGLERKLASEHEETRRHMDMVAESFREYVKMLADGISRNTERLDGHETRISALERR